MSHAKDSTARAWVLGGLIFLAFVTGHAVSKVGPNTSAILAQYHALAAEQETLAAR